jgi:hypothetical protein
VASGAEVLEGERAERVIVMPAGAVAGLGESGEPVQRRGGRAWVEIA